jgi:hypothetical protein
MDSGNNFLNNFDQSIKIERTFCEDQEKTLQQIMEYLVKVLTEKNDFH